MFASISSPALHLQRSVLASGLSGPRSGRALACELGLPSGHAHASLARFAGRCPVAVPACSAEEPPLREAAPGHWVRCIRVDHIDGVPRAPLACSQVRELRRAPHGCGLMRLLACAMQARQSGPADQAAFPPRLQDADVPDGGMLDDGSTPGGGMPDGDGGASPAQVTNEALRSMLEGPSSITASSIDVDFLVTVDHEDAVGRRSRHRAGVLRHRPRGPDKRLCRQRASPCSLNRVDGRVGEPCARTAFVIKPNVMKMCILLVQRAGQGLA